RVESSKDQESLDAPEDASKQGRSIEDIDVDVDVSLVDEAQERQNDDLMFDSEVLEDDVSTLRTPSISITFSTGLILRTTIMTIITTIMTTTSSMMTIITTIMTTTSSIYCWYW
ncbi:hypothetical protein Tco_0329582, partial [Tanacetum coccineum]